MQTELIYGLCERSFKVVTEKKVDLGCDFIVDGIKVEIRSAPRPLPSWLINGMKKHPKAQMFFFLNPSNEKAEKKISAYVKANKMEILKRELDDSWVIMVVKK